MSVDRFFRLNILFILPIAAAIALWGAVISAEAPQEIEETPLEPPAWIGAWQTNLGQLVLEQQGDSLRGRYFLAGGPCTLEGKIRQDKLTFRYREPTTQGEGWLQLSPDGKSFSGKWRADKAVDWFSWEGVRLQQNPLNLDFEQGVGNGDLPMGWDVSAIHPKSGGEGYQISLDSEVVHRGKRSVRIHCLDCSPAANFGTLTQGIAADQHRGRRLRLSGSLRTESVSGGVGLWMRVGGPQGMLVFDNMSNRFVTGTGAWQEYSVVHQIPPQATLIAFGILHNGRGTVWADDLKLEEVTEDVPVTTIVSWVVPERGSPVNLDFEGGVGRGGLPSGWDDPAAMPRSGGRGYQAALDAEAPQQGRFSARLRSLDSPQGRDESGHLTQGIRAAPYRGQRVRLTGLLRTLSVSGRAALWIRADGHGGPLAFESTQDRPVQGTVGWQERTVSLLIAQEALRISFGVILTGDGTVWADSFKLEASAAEEEIKLPVNMDFEAEEEIPNWPTGWSKFHQSSPEFEIALDRETVFQGEASGRIRFRPDEEATKKGFGAVVQQIPAGDYKGKRLQLSGQLKAQDAQRSAGFWMRIDSPFGVLAFDNMWARGVHGTTDWQWHSVVHDVPEEASLIAFGAILQAPGTLWFDDLKLDAVEPDVAVTTASGFVLEPTAQQKSWISSQALPLQTVEAGSGFADLMPLTDLIGDARIVSLGEGTHGTREFFQMKHRLVEFLASEMGFSLFSIEASMPEAYRLNDYVLGGPGDAAELIDGMHFWTWRTEEVLALVDWMRQFNQQQGRRIEFGGFDMQFPDLPMQIVLKFLDEVDPERSGQVKDTYNRVSNRSTSLEMDFGIAMGNFPPAEARQKRVRFSGAIRTEELSGWAGLWWRVDGPNGTLAFDNMVEQGPRGTTPWKKYEIELEVAAEASIIVFGALMTGRGRAWFDDLKVELDGVEYRNQNLFDFDFEEDQMRGFFSRAKGYRNLLDHQNAFSGRQSLRIESLSPPVVGQEEPPLELFESARLCRHVVEQLESARPRYLQKADSKAVDWAIQNARIVHQHLRAQLGSYAASRDKSMAENVRWILQQNPAAKVILWAHNGHVSRGKERMGAHLAEWFGREYLAVAFATSQGEYFAGGRGGLGTFSLQPPRLGSAEAMLKESGIPILILDVRPAQAGSAASGWLHQRRPFRSIGAGASEHQFSNRVLAQDFDLLIYIDNTQAAVQLPKEE